MRDLEQVMALGSENRSVGATLMNVDSSRSHSIFTIDLEMLDKGMEGEDAGRLRAGRLNLVDLAGSERQSKTGATGEGAMQLVNSLDCPSLVPLTLYLRQSLV